MQKKGLTYNCVELGDEARDLGVVPVSVPRLVLKDIVGHVTRMHVIRPRDSDRRGHDIADPH